MSHFVVFCQCAITDGKPFALYEQILNPAHPGTLEGLRRLARQTHLHVVLVGPDNELLELYEFKNPFGMGTLIAISERACVDSRKMDFAAAKREYDERYELLDLFNNSEHLAEADPDEEEDN